MKNGVDVPVAFVVFALLFPFPLFAQTAAQRVGQIIETAPTLRTAVWGVLIEEENGTVLYERNAHTLMIPASNRKLFAAATVASCESLTTRLTTELWRDGDDLILKGDGDPSLGAWRHGREDDLQLLVDAVVRRHITRVRDVVADVSAFDRTTLPGSWKVGNLLSTYSAPVDALAWQENVAADHSVADAALATSAALRAALEEAGVHVRGLTRMQVEARPWKERLLVLQSPFVSQLLSTSLMNSQNLYTEMLFKGISPAPASYSGAALRERQFLVDEVGIPADEFRFVDGSGLAVDDVVTPASVVKLLRWMNAPGRRGIWWSLMPQPGASGTLHYRLQPLSDRMRGKTGTLNGVNALSGIVRGSGGDYRYFSIILNHHLADSDEAEKVIDEIVMEISRF